jgi:hypothetical protein
MSGEFIFALALFGLLFIDWVALPIRAPRK